jgi:chromosome segregation ATPase
VRADLPNGVTKPTNDEEVKKVDDDDTAARFEALVKDRDALRLEVIELRKSLEELQSKHTVELETAQNELADAQTEKENAEEQYQSLLGKVNTIRSQLGDRLKADAVRACSHSHYHSSCTHSHTHVLDLHQILTPLLC